LKTETIQAWHLGYAPQESEGWRKLYEYLLSKGYSDEEMEKTGMTIKFQISNLKSQISYYDRFRGRIMFPIFDFSGRVVGFSGRLYPEIEKEGVGKYINSPQTVLYDKSKILYGFDKAKTEIRKNNACVLVEGQMDVLMSHQAGVTNSVAVSGTGLTHSHLESVGRLTNNLIVSFDSDEAGLIAAGRGIDLALEKGFEVKVVVLPFGKDPADVVNKEPEAWQKAVDGARHIIDFYLKTLSEKITDSRELKRKVEQVVLPYLSYIQSEIERSHWVGEIAKRLNMREEPIWEQLKKMKLKELKIEGDMEPRARTKTRRILLEERLLGIVFWRNDAKIIPDEKKYLFSDKRRLLFENFLAKKAPDTEEKNYSDRLSLETELCYTGIGTEEFEKEMQTLLNDLEQESIREQLETIMADIKLLEAGRDESKKLDEKINEANELTKRLNGLKKFKINTQK
jgi:DNA primase